MDSPFQAGREHTLLTRLKKDFSKTACGWHGMGYVFDAHENGRSVFPVERRFDGPATEINCVHAGPFFYPRFFQFVFRCVERISGEFPILVLHHNPALNRDHSRNGMGMAMAVKLKTGARARLTRPPR
jgi:hypothetical protein